MQVGTPVKTNAQGQFLIAGAPVGFFKLMADGTTVAAQRGVFPTLEYDIVTVAGQDNTVGMPMLLPLLDTANKLCVSETTGGTLTLPEVPGFSLTVAPGLGDVPRRVAERLRHRLDGERRQEPDDARLRPAAAVHRSRFSRSGTMFNPPAPITMPNVDGLQPGQVTELYSYDHDLSRLRGDRHRDGQRGRPARQVGSRRRDSEGRLALRRKSESAGQRRSGQRQDHDSCASRGREGRHHDHHGHRETTSLAPIPGRSATRQKPLSKGRATGAASVIKGVASGKVTVTVRFTCDSVDQNGVHPFAEASIEVTVAAVTDVTAAGATKMTKVLAKRKSSISSRRKARAMSPSPR